MSGAHSDPNQTPYTPLFNDAVRTAVYVVCLVASIVSLGFVLFGDDAVGSYIGTSASIIAAGFGVAYNPTRLSSK